LAVPAGFEGATIDEVSCAAARECVIHIWGNGEGTFLFTDNGGLTWSTASIVPPAASGTLWALRCDPNGSCIGLIPTGSVQHPSTEGITSLRTSDGGRTWTASSANLAVGPGTLLISCGDAMHCLAAYSSVTSATIAIATTSNGGGGWRVTAPPPSWPNTAISVSCATGLNCFVSAASATDNGYNHPVIAATHDGGITWVPLTLPDLPGSQLALVFPLSCPIGDGCVGVGATELEFAPPTTMPASGSVPDIGQRVIVSNLVASTG